MLMPKNYFAEAKSGNLYIPQEFENHLKSTYSNNVQDIPIPPMKYLLRPQDSTIMFDNSGIKLRQVQGFVHNAHTCSAFRMNGISYKIIHAFSGNSPSSSSRSGSRVLYHKNGVLLMVFGYLKK